MSYRVHPLLEPDWAVLRRVRLRALGESPAAFGSTLAREAEFSEALWRERARGSATTRLFMAWLGDAAVGITGVLDEGDGTAQLVSVWVDPEHRGRGVARAMATAALSFAAGSGLAVMRLWVTEGNHSARTLYERLGFTPTGNRQPLPSDPSLQEHELERQLSGVAGPLGVGPVVNHPIG